jgi:hypothetical protein
MIAEALTSIKEILLVGSVIASEAKQSILPFLGTMDCVVGPVIFLMIWRDSLRG